MTALAKQGMSVDEFLAWAIAQPEPLKADLIDGHVYAQAPQRLAHIQVKVAATIALGNAIKTAGLSCYAVGHGATVRISDTTAFEPDALVYCGGKLPGDAI